MFLRGCAEVQSATRNVTVRIMLWSSLQHEEGFTVVWKVVVKANLNDS